MNWSQLLSAKRVKALWGQKSSDIALGDPRSEFDRDYGRTVFSTPVRRLQDKAQVFPLERHDAIRTRLTHSLEVSSVARSFGEALERIALKKHEIDADKRGCIPSIAATCGLIHDLGNPPFGHAGELAISSWFRELEKNDPSTFDDFRPKDKDRDLTRSQYAQDFLRFEGNAQTQRLLSRLQVLADDFGLNLTCGTLSASCKYIAPSNEIDARDQAKKKHGFFASENDLINRIREEVGTGYARNPIAFLVEASDDIVYSTVDLEDGVKKQCVAWDFVENELRKRGDCDCLRRALAKAADKIAPADFRGQTRDEALAVAFRTFAITEMVVATIRLFENEYDRIMDGLYPYELLYKSDAAPLAQACKEIGFAYIYVAPEVLKREIMGRQIIFDLLDLYWEAAQQYEKGKKMKDFPKKIYSQISSNYRQVFEHNIESQTKSGIPGQYFRMQLVTDQIAGMTDSFAASLHRELTNG